MVLVLWYEKNLNVKPEVKRWTYRPRDHKKQQKKNPYLSSILYAPTLQDSEKEPQDRYVMTYTIKLLKLQ